jgi:hypothetical protein
MTTEERLDRLEHWTAGLAEERNKDREEFRMRWRDTQRQIDENARHIMRLDSANAELGIHLRNLADEAREADRRLEAKIEALGERIAALVSGIGQFIAERGAK